MNQRISATQTKEEAIKSALLNFVARNTRLPCPTVITIASGSPNDGVEAATPGTCTSTFSSGSGANTVVTGAIPWLSLGLQSEVALDGYARRFTYQVVRAATNLTSSTISGMKGAITVHSAGPGVLGVSPTGNQTNDCSGGLTYNPCAGVVAIVSHGNDGYGAYTPAGIQIPFPASITGSDERENADADGMIVIKTYSGNEINPYDDIVMIQTPGELLSTLVTGGSMKDYRATLNQTFDLIKGAIIADALQHHSGAPRSVFYPLSSSGNIPNLTAAQIQDPWGNSISYVRVTNNISSSTSSNSTAFTLTSSGPDGIAPNSDDIALTVTVAELQGIFAKSGF